MKKVLTIAMILGVIMAIQPVSAGITQPLASHTDHSQITLACGCNAILP